MTRRQRRRLSRARAYVRRHEGLSRKPDVVRFHNALHIVEDYQAKLPRRLDALFRRAYTADVMEDVLFRASPLKALMSA